MLHLEFRGENRKKHRYGEDLKPPPRGHVPAEDRGEVPSELPKPSRAAAFAVATAHDRGYVRRLSEVCRVVRCSALPCAPSRGPDRDTSIGAACGWVHSAAPRPAVMSVALFCPGVRHHVSRQAIKTTFSGTWKLQPARPSHPCLRLGKGGEGAVTVSTVGFLFVSLLKRPKGGQLVIIINLKKLRF